MEIAAPNSLPAFGFLTVVEDEFHGFFGGYLVLSELGRPLEFHCTTPVLPSQAQKILYGSTLRSFVLGELIGQTLVKKAQVPVQAVLTDLQEMLGLELVWQGILAWVAPLKTDPLITDSGAAASQTAQQDPAVMAADPAALGSPSLDLGSYRLAGSSTCCWSSQQLSHTLAPLVSYVDLTEPFQRIHEAIHEAQRATHHPTEEADEHSAAA